MYPQSIGPSEFVYLHFEAEVDSDIMLVKVVGPAVRIRETHKDAGIVVIASAQPLNSKHEVRRHGRRIPKQAKFAAGDGFEDVVHTNEGADIALTSHLPVCGGNSVEKRAEAWLRRIDGRLDQVVDEAAGERDAGEHRIWRADAW